jgi:hypothetical protein
MQQRDRSGRCPYSWAFLCAISWRIYWLKGNGLNWALASMLHRLYGRREDVSLLPAGRGAFHPPRGDASWTWLSEVGEWVEESSYTPLVY